MTGHGHVTPNPDGRKARCGGPALCDQCAREQGQKERLNPVREVTQTILYTAELNARGVFGNCLQAAMASALGLDLDAVPHFGAFAWWEEAARLWLRGRGLDWRMVDGIPPGRAIVVGPTVRETGDHAVVGDDGQIVWDPHPSRAGLTRVKRSYVLEGWPGAEPSGCVCCGAMPTQ